jgi:3-oxoacyl-[acyl-carrier-protein] synthase II
LLQRFTILQRAHSRNLGPGSVRLLPYPGGVVALVARGGSPLKRRQAVITGLGIVSPIGVGVERFWAAARAGQSGIGTPTMFDASKLPRECQIVGEVRDFDVKQWMPGAAGRMAGRFSQFAVAAAKMAREDARLDTAQIPPERIKVSIGTSMNGLTDVHQPAFNAFIEGTTMPPWTSLEYPAHAATSHVAIRNRVRGQTMSFATACAAGLDAVGWATEEVIRGNALAVIAGGTETPLSQATLTAFQAVGVLSRWEGPPSEASRPFDNLRSGLVAAEGAATVVIEEEEAALARGATLLARILGFASVSEGGNLRKIDETGAPAARVIALALEQASLAPTDIDYVCAHGNSMREYDLAETAGLKQVLGRHAWNVPISSLKSMCGQAFAASSAMQVVGACLSLRDQIIPPTINYLIPDPDCNLDYVPNVARRARIRHVLIHAHSMGGTHAALVLSKID